MMGWLTANAVAALLLSTTVLTSATDNKNNGRSWSLGPPRTVESSTTLTTDDKRSAGPISLASSWPWIHPGGASASATPTDDTPPLVLSKDEELGSVEVTIPMTTTTTTSTATTEVHTSAQDAPLFRDIAMLTDILLDVVKDEDEKIHDLYLEFLKYGKERYVLVRVPNVVSAAIFKSPSLT